MSELFELIRFKRSTELYLRALWGKGFSIQLSEYEHENAAVQSYLIHNNIFLPKFIPLNDKNVSYYRAAAAHASAHSIYSQSMFETGDLNLLQRSMIGLIEDLRVELLSIKKFPGLRNLWLKFHDLPNIDELNVMNLMVRLSRSILDPLYEDSHYWVVKGKHLLAEKSHELTDQDLSVTLGLRLANDLGQMRLPLNSGRYEQPILYRDDNKCLWEKQEEHHQQEDSVNAKGKSDIKKNKLEESSRGIQLAIAENTDHGKGFYIRQRENDTLKYRHADNHSNNNKIFYPEWDYRSQVLKKNWCTLIERNNVKGSIDKVEKILNAHKNILAQLRFIAKKLQTQKIQRVRKMHEGDGIDFDPMINAMVALRMKQTPDNRVFVRDEYRHSKMMAISILLDLSESTNKKIVGTNLSVSSMLRDAVMLLGETLSIANEQFSISGFSSNGRHEINFINFKSFSENFYDSRLRLTDIKGQYSTRMGAAIRHSAIALSQQPARKKLLLVITDGEPSDIDVYDPSYLKHDSRNAVNSLSKLGIKSFCLNLDTRSDSVIEQIFGKARYETLEQLIQLPQVLSRIYIRYGRH